MPAPSCPRIAGNKPSGSAPERVNSSVWQMPVALISTSTSPAFGPSSFTVSIVKGAPALCATAARTSITYLREEFCLLVHHVDFHVLAPRLRLGAKKDERL